DDGGGRLLGLDLSHLSGREVGRTRGGGILAVGALAEDLALGVGQRGLRGLGHPRRLAARSGVGEAAAGQAQDEYDRSDGAVGRAFHVHTSGVAVRPDTRLLYTDVSLSNPSR